MTKFVSHYSDKELMEIWKVDDLRIHLIKTVIELDNDESMDDCLGMFKSVQHLRKQCFNPPDSIQEKMEVINELISGFGIEAIRHEKHFDKYYGDAIGLYINLGDTYTTTIVYNTIDREFETTSWGDYLEAKESELEMDSDI